MAIERTLVMEFKTEGDKTQRIRVSGAREDLEAAEVNAVMNSIVSKNIFLTSSGDITAKASAYIIAREITEIPLS
ncbi:Protein of unknown function [Thermosyntropha lipolytica DSM 11003]|uniref:DUF2922 domain-containing protein n=1 Tax=Thermosyntropha lipolytica DSM 11003 TaxID=1123382 RepID=A0A1M5Q4M2_9FIRM|nr:DUF2922 domain-containing protein [Thermosyntropha lipolytica]SHH09064.1 Protein of unknown function [Thermosyntropha lipolytica DSM 11003]